MSLKKSGVQKGMPIAAFLRSGAQHALGVYAAALLGCPFVPVNASLAGKADEIQHILSIAQAQVLMVWDDNMANQMTQAMSSQLASQMQVKVICNPSSSKKPEENWHYLTNMLREEQSRKETLPRDEHESQLDDVSLIFFTSGTTSRPKGVSKTNQIVVAGIRSHAQVQALDSSRSFCDILPSFHIYGFMWMLAFWSCGGTVCFPSELFEPEATLQAISDEKLTNLSGVPMMMQALIRAKSESRASLESLLSIAVAGSMISPDMLKDISRGLGVHRISTSFGMSEASPTTSLPFKELPYEFKGDVVTAGKCSPGVRLRVCEPNSCKVLERGATGELHIGGATTID